MLEVEHADSDLARIEIEKDFIGGFSKPVAKQFRIVMQLVRTVSHEGQLCQFPSRKFEKLKGKRKHQHSLRLNKQWRLIVELYGKAPNKKIVIKAIENHYGD